jgi:glycosyltransferase involved in cell wall biosynthesis
MDDLISVILPVYNCEKYLDKSVQSILTQTYENFELILINDGSTDNSLEVLKKYKEQDKRVTIINRENKGLVYSLNEGITISKGKYIARMDQDDISLPDRFSKQYELLEQYELDICGCHWHVIDEDDKFIDCRIVPLDEHDILITLSNTVPFAHGSVMIRKSFLDRKQMLYGLSTTYAEDYALWVDMYLNDAKFGNVDSYEFLYRMFPFSMSQINKKNNYRDTETNRKRLRVYKSKHIFDAIKKSIIQDRRDFKKDEELVYAILNLIKFKNLKILKLLIKLNKKALIFAFFNVLKKNIILFLTPAK